MTDWEAIFEAQPDGLIPLVTSSANPKTLKKCMSVIIDSLFIRDHDDQKRQSYLSTLDELLPDNLDPKSLLKVKEKITQLLRVIKKERIRKGDECTQNDSTVSEVFDEDRQEDAPPQIDAKKTSKNDFGNDAVKKVFADVCWDVIHQRFKVLHMRISDKRQNDGSLPFILSEKFTARFERVLREYVIPEMAGKCRGVIVRTSLVPEEEQFTFMHDSFEDKKGRELLWNSWQNTWDAVMYEKEVPEKPKEKKKSLLSVLKKEKKNTLWKGKTLTLEEWEKISKETKDSNKRARDIWKIMLEDTGEYKIPLESDGNLLKDLFGRSATGLRKQIEALKQIAEQGGNIGKAFDIYQQSKNLELSMLGVAYQYEEFFLNPPHEKTLKLMLGGFSETQKKQHYSLVLRYLSSYL